MTAQKWKQNVATSNIVNINYATISKVLEEKNYLIVGQEKTIENLKNTLDKCKK